MPNEQERNALSKIRAYLDDGRSMDEIKGAGWGSWIDQLEAKGYDLRTGRLALRPPKEEPAPDLIQASAMSDAAESTATTQIAETDPLQKEIAWRSAHGWQLVSQAKTEARMWRPKRFSIGWAFLGLLAFGIGLIAYLEWYFSKREEVAHLRMLDQNLDIEIDGAPFELLLKPIEFWRRWAGQRMASGGPAATRLVAPLRPVRAWWTWSSGRRTSWGRLAAYGAPLLAAAALFIGISLAISVGDSEGNRPTSQGTGASSGRAVDFSVLEQSAVVFEGGYSEGEIKRALDRAMKLYDHPISENSYDGATNMLVQFRLDYGVREMDVLDVMIRSHVPGLDVTFVAAAAIAAAVLSTGADY